MSTAPIIGAHHGALQGGGGSWLVIPGQTCVAAWKARGAASLAASYVNLANPGTYDAAPGVAPTWAAETGWMFDGTSQYLTTGIIPSAIGWSFFVRFGEITADRNGGCGLYSSTSAFNVRPLLSGKRTYQHSGDLTITGSAANHVMGFAGKAAYLDGVRESASIAAGTSTPSIEVHLGRTNYGSFLGLAGVVVAAAIYSTTLTDSDAATLSAAMAAL